MGERDGGVGLPVFDPPRQVIGVALDVGLSGASFKAFLSRRRCASMPGASMTQSDPTAGTDGNAARFWRVKLVRGRARWVLMREPVRTSDQIRDAIDRGKAGDKVNVSDPAAAPLGTDAEAAGFSPTPRERKMTKEGLGPERNEIPGGALTTLVGYGGIVLALGISLIALVLAGLGIIH